ncbi:MAG: TetR family transcriptional regulator C-terminal domain-containing protein, partial [Holophagales bacterium]|nr:TetR family transcriptional regulator C-terminal domain-containing protein [Holophagales bacterium]
QNGCPVGNLALEMSTQDPQLRDRLLQTIEGHAGYFERVSREAKTRGEIDSGLDPREAAENLVALMEGKILVSKLRNDPESLSDLASTALRLLGVRQRPGSGAEAGTVGIRATEER